MSKIDNIVDESICRFNDGLRSIQGEYAFLSRYIDEDEKEQYAKAFVSLEDIIQTIECKIGDMND